MPTTRGTIGIGNDRATRSTRRNIRFGCALTILAFCLFPSFAVRSESNPAAASSSADSPAHAVDTTEAALRDELRTLEAQNPNSIEVTKDLDLLAWYFWTRGRFSDAEPLLIQSLAIKEKILPADDMAIQENVDRLAEIYIWQGRLPEAEHLLDRALQSPLETDAGSIWLVGRAHVSMGTLYLEEGRQQEAERLLKQGLELRLRTITLGMGIEITYDLQSLAELYCEEGRFAEAESLGSQAIKLSEPNSLRYAYALKMLADAYYGEGRYAEAERFYSESGAIFLSQMGDAHVSYEQNLGSLGLTLAKEGKVSAARDSFQKAWAVNLNAWHSMTQSGSESLRFLRKQSDRYVRGYLELLAAIARHPEIDPGGAPPQPEAFMVAEQSRRGITDLALVKAAVRLAVADPAAGEAAAAVQQLTERRAAIAMQLSTQFSASNDSQQDVVKVLNESQQLDSDLKAANQRLIQVFPKYGELATPLPIDVDGVQRALHPDEALVSYYALDDRLLAWCVRPGHPLAYRDTEVKRADLLAMIAHVRESLRPDKPFDIVDSYALYRLLIAPLKDELASTKSLIIVPDQVTLPVPFAALVTDNTGDAFAALAQDYKQGLAPTPAELKDNYPRIAWLAKSSMSISLLPTATSLRLLRNRVGVSSATNASSAKAYPFVGIGDPLLSGKGEERGSSMVATRGAEAIDVVRNLPRLPGSREELMAEAKALDANPQESLFMEERATRPQVLALSKDRLRDAKVISFATHALIGGEMKGVMEPSLVLTPPSQPSTDDDGLLTMDDVMGFKLVADEWVILSACNTAAPDGSGEGLSGLTRAFFYAGTPSLLVSQWSVDDAATDQLMTAVFTAYGSGSGVSRSTALQGAMLKLMDAPRTDPTHAYFAHPFAWAPFVVVGEGGAPQQGK
jgi:CHAT domain-containing protein/tetratricopeptide (TPR) repeat protein